MLNEQDFEVFIPNIEKISHFSNQIKELQEGNDSSKVSTFVTQRFLKNERKLPKISNKWQT